ncbi:hypothetical protein GCM10010964_28940 [Caldovatus sediminis]|uniref:Uncharacterized protein n=1 Tax=Caldovatus sediminis TaxID=2041189 RepID=A0A8J2ZC81_9PROT|nr:hypothetical protein GCM10010964_28940 [Caldovatus sediminis]
MMGWRTDWVRPAPGALASKPVVAGVVGTLGFLAGKMAPPTAVTTRAAPAPTRAPRTPPPTAAEATPEATTAISGTAAGMRTPHGIAAGRGQVTEADQPRCREGSVSRSSRRWRKW